MTESSTRVVRHEAAKGDINKQIESVDRAFIVVGALVGIALVVVGLYVCAWLIQDFLSR